METIILVVILILSVIAVFQLYLLGRRTQSGASHTLPNLLRDEFRASRTEATDQAKSLREEIAASQKSGSESLVSTVKDLGRLQQESINAVEKRVRSIAESNESRLERLREVINEQLRSIQANDKAALENMQGSIGKSLDGLKQAQQKELEVVENRVKALSDANNSKLEKLREAVERQLKEIQDTNDKKLEQMRATVDEKLHSTLEKRLGASFKLVSERLEAVQRGLGDMQNLATGVGDLKRVLTNVKTRGTWGEYQLGNILEQVLSPDQYQKNVKPKPNSSDTVEFAIRLPGQKDSDQVWLPIDAKFPHEDYQRLLDASEAADAAAVEKSTDALARSIQKSARDISQKYIEPPYTTDFAIMFLPTEGLYAEVLRQPGMIEKLQQNHRIVVAGPTTLAATLSSLRMGFRTLAIEKRSSEVWEVLSAVKTEFGKFGNVLAKVKKQLNTAANTIDNTAVRTRAMERKLKSVEALPADESSALLEMGEAEYFEESGELIGAGSETDVD